MQSILKKYFGYDEFRPKQLDIINSILNKQDTLVLMPTGGGKSLCYQIPALKQDGLTIVISPLISLMKDQVDALKLKGVNAEYINSTLSKETIEDIKIRIEKKEVKILYITPERLALKSFKLFLEKTTVSLFAIDEAHCISEWGHDFRKDYRNLKFLKKEFPNTPIIALTATATSKVKQDILRQLNLENPKIFTSSFDRDNLKLIIREKKHAFAQIISLVDKYKNESIIIYCHSRKDTKTLADGLNKYGFKALIYHAGLTDKVRDRNQELFIKDKANIMVATIAFGMGIDKSNVRLIIHNTFSKSIEGYYQEIGRAGRDGLPSECVLFYSPEDKRKHEFFIERSSTVTQRQKNSLKLNEMVSYCESQSCRRKYLLEYFGEKVSEDDCQGCDICLNLVPVTNKEINKNKQTIKRNLKFDNELFKELKTLRKEIALREDIQPTHIFEDVSLKEMATIFPKTEQDFMKISGVGEQKLNNFGEEFLITINEHLMVNNIVNTIDNNKLNEFEGIIADDKPVFKKYKKKKSYGKTKKYKYKKKK